MSDNRRSIAFDPSREVGDKGEGLRPDRAARLSESGRGAATPANYEVQEKDRQQRLALLKLVYGKDPHNPIGFYYRERFSDDR